MELKMNITMSKSEFLQFKLNKDIKPLFVKNFIDCIYDEIDETEKLNKLIQKSKNVEIRIKNLNSKNLIKINEIYIEINNFVKEEFLRLNNIVYNGLIIYTLTNPDYPLIDMFEDLENLINQTSEIDIWVIPITDDYISTNEIILGIITLI